MSNRLSFKIRANISVEVDSAFPDI